MDIDKGVDVWYQVENRGATRLEGFTGKYVDDLLKEIKETEMLLEAPSMLQPFVKLKGSEKEIRSLEESQRMSFRELIKTYPVDRWNPIIVRLPGTLHSSRLFRLPL